jgi:DNA repair protein RadC
MTIDVVRERTIGARISQPSDIHAVLARSYSKRQESFHVVTLDTAHNVTSIKLVSLGTLDRTIVHCRDILYWAIKVSAAALIIAHNHPSGTLTASAEDDALTLRVKAACDIMGIPLLDHIIYSKHSYLCYSETKPELLWNTGAKA